MMCYERLLTNPVSRMRASRRHFLHINTKLAKLRLNLVPLSTAKYTVLKRQIGKDQQAPASIPCEALHPWRGGSIRVRHQSLQTATAFKVTALMAIWTVDHISRLPQRHFSFQAGLGIMERSAKWRTEG